MKARENLNKRKKRKQSREAQRQNASDEVSALQRRMDAILKLNIFLFGSIWAVGEELWKQALPLGYDGESVREMHPGLCTRPPSAAMISATVMMLFGSHSREGRRRSFIVDDPLDEGDTHPCYFGAFPPVGLDPTTYGNADSEIRTHIRFYKRRQRILPQARQDELRQFLHDIYAWEDRI